MFSGVGLVASNMFCSLLYPLGHGNLLEMNNLLEGINANKEGPADKWPWKPATVLVRLP